MNNINVNFVEMVKTEINDLYKDLGIRRDFDLNQINTIDELVTLITVNIAKQIDAVIEMEMKKPYVIDNVENRYILFAETVVIYILTENMLMSENIKRLFNNRHFGYNYYNEINSYNIEYFDFTHYKDYLQDNKDFEKTLYLALVEFYYRYFGKFRDNEKAIELICKYYPKGIVFDDSEKDVISKTLYNHISVAGEQGNVGFAYNGIKNIMDNISHVEEGILIRILNQYNFSNVCRDNVYRRQILTIIKYGEFKNYGKSTLKFFYIDSVVILDIIDIIFRRNSIDSLKAMQIDYQKISELTINFGNIMLISKLSEQVGRIIESENEKILEIVFCDEEINIIYENKTEKIKIKLDDWILNYYNSDEFSKKIGDLISVKKLKTYQITYSYAYLNNYRGLKDQHLSFDKKFIYQYEYKKTRKINKRISRVCKEKYEDYSNFYGQNIYSLSCIVGKNGTGKTSIIDFLANNFVGILFSLGIDIAKNKIEIQNKISNLKLDSKFEILVIINVDGKSYLITNIEDINLEAINCELEECKDSDCEKIHEYNLENIVDNSANFKILYFSNKIDINYDKFENARRLPEYGKIDYSAQTSFIYNYQIQDENLVNKDFYYLVYFLKYNTDENLKKLLWQDFNKADIKLDKYYNEYSELLIDVIKDDSLIVNPLLNDQFMQIPEKSNIRLKHFSSGEYAKILFLAKLYWCLKGYRKYKIDVENTEDKVRDVFDANNTIRDNETGIIFIDEGELYYHPEWQRTYISTLVNLINENLGQSQVQIVMTTNSPFILSDVIADNAIYIPHDTKKEVTFGQNIHTLLTSNFFMEDTIGEVSREIIKLIASKLIDEEDSLIDESMVHINSKINSYFKEDRSNKYLENIINNIGEDIYRIKLQHLLTKYTLKNKAIEELLEQKKLIEIKISQLEKQIKGDISDKVK